jgi:hypothetical protein
MYVHARPVSPATVQQIMPTLYTNGNLDTWKILCLIATKFEPFVFPVLGFYFVYVSDIYIIVSLYDFRLLPTYFCYVTLGVRNPEHPI